MSNIYFNALSPKLKKCSKIEGKKIIFTNVTEDDAAFITELRNSSKKNRFLSKTSSNVSDQIEWIKKYNQSTTQAYFIIRDYEYNRIGTVRLYDPIENSFCWGSWIIKDGSDKSAALESALIIYNYAIYLGFSEAHIDVRNLNTSVRKFHERFGAVVTSSNELDTFYEVSNESIVNSLKKYNRFLPNGIKIAL